MGFTKLDEGILQSSIMAEDSDIFKVFISLLAACESDGIAKVSAIFLSSVTHIPIEKTSFCLEKLESPDKFSRSTNDEGKRIRRINGGYEIINYKKYREFTYSDNPESVRKRVYRKEKWDMSQNVPNSTGHSASASASASKTQEGMQGVNSPPSNCPAQAEAPASPSNKSGRTGKHLFKNCIYFDFQKFREALSEWSEEKCKHYHNRALLYSEQNSKMYHGWIATVKTWERMDNEKGKPFREIAKTITPTKYFEQLDQGIAS